MTDREEDSVGKRVLRISPELLVGILRGMRFGQPRYFDVVENAIPEDAWIVGTRMNDQGWWLEITLASSQWADGTEVDIEPKFRALYCDRLLPESLRRELQQSDCPSVN